MSGSEEDELEREEAGVYILTILRLAIHKRCEASHKEMYTVIK